MKEGGRKIILVFFALFALILILGFGIYLIVVESSKGAFGLDKIIGLGDDRVQEIIDGDTFRLENGDVVRLLCVNTPEKGEKGYEEAIGFLGGRLIYESIVLEGNTTDRYGRLLRWVYVNNSLINKEIVDNKFGKIFEYDNEDCSKLK